MVSSMDNTETTLTTCTACGATCDDIRLEVGRDGKLAKAHHACELGEPWLLQSTAGGAAARVQQQAASVEEAIERAAEILLAAKMPLLAGLQNASTEAVRAAVELADRLGAAIDWTTSPADAASTLALQTAGGVTATWGEVAQRADLVLLWASDLATTHPRHFERYSLHPTSAWLPDGRSDRMLVVVDSSPTKSSQLADQAIEIAPGRDYEALTVLRSLVSGIELDEETVRAQTGVELKVWSELAKRMKAAKFGAAIYGKRAAAVETIVELTNLMADLTATTRWVSLSEGGPGNATGASSALAWQTGAPLAVNFAAGKPEYGPREWTTAHMLERNETDAVLVMGGEWPESLRTALAKRPTIVLDWRETELTNQAEVALRVARPGVECGGTTYRVDGVALPMRAATSCEYPSAESVLKQIAQRLPA